jgi:hypothetical protein
MVATLGAFPPVYRIGRVDDVARTQLAVVRWMPLLGDLSAPSGQ